MKTSNKLLLAALLFSNYFVFIFFISPHLFHRPAISSILFLIQVHSNPRHSCQPTSAETIQQMLSPSAHFPIQFAGNLPTTRKCFLTIMSFHVGVNFIIIRPIHTRTNISLLQETAEAEEKGEEELVVSTVARVPGERGNNKKWHRCHGRCSTLIS